jgi:stage V sporulation protein G
MGKANQQHMKVTTVKVQLSKEEIVLAYVDITINNCWALHGLKVIRHPTGLMLAMPRKKGIDGKPYDVAFPITAEKTRTMIEEAADGGVHKEGYFQSYEIETVAPANEAHEPKAIK